MGHVRLTNLLFRPHFVRLKGDIISRTVDSLVDTEYSLDVYNFVFRLPITQKMNVGTVESLQTRDSTKDSINQVTMETVWNKYTDQWFTKTWVLVTLLANLVQLLKTVNYFVK